jgi:GT2 family glycosyltransferase
MSEIEGKFPAMSIVIVTYNSAGCIVSCLDSVFAQPLENAEVIVVDNGSGDDTRALIRQRFPSVRLIENTSNEGACEARNRGIGLASGEWILTLDCDTVLKKDFLKALYVRIKTSPPKVGMVQPKILRSDEKTIYSCGIYLSWSRRFYDIGSGDTERGQYDGNGIIFGPCAAAALYKRTMLESVKESAGYFDRRFFFLVEDVDLAWRGKKKGWTCVFAPEAVCYHAGNSSRSGRKERQYLCARNRFLAIRKNEGLPRYLVKVLPALWYDLPRSAALLLGNPFFRRSLLKNEKNI